MVATLATVSQAIRQRAAQGSPELQRRFNARLRAMQALARVPRKEWKRTARRLAAELSVEHPRGLSAKTIMNLWRAFRAEGAEALLFGYGANDDRLPEAFQVWLKRRAENNKRVASVELRAIVAEWRAGETLPGYGTWQQRWAEQMAGEPVPPFCPEWFVPGGWSERNLGRYLDGEAATTLARGGYFEAHSSLPQLRQDYSEVRPLEGVIFDDVKTDWLVAVPGQARACEFWLLVALDACSRLVLDWVSLVVVPDQQGHKQSLLEAHMDTLVGQLLFKYGIPSGYTSHWTVENAKATIRPEKRALLAALSGGAIDVEPTRMVNRALPSGFAERHGTPWGTKALLESFFRTFHDHGAALPGQTGSVQMLNAPADLAGREKEHKALMEEVGDLPAEVVAQLESTFLTQAEAIAAVERIFHTLNRREKHRLQGFERVQTWRFPEDLAWRPLEDLRRYGKADVARAIFSSPRPEQPIERFERLLRVQKPFIPVPEDALIPFLARVVRKVRHPAPYTLAWREGGVERIYRGELPALASGRGGPFIAKVLPHNIAVAHVYLAEGERYLGAIGLVHAPSPFDDSARHRAIAEVQHYRKLVAQPVMDRHAPDREAEDARRARNAAVQATARAGAGMLAQEAAAVATTKRQDKATRANNARRARQLADLAAANLSPEQ